MKLLKEMLAVWLVLVAASCSSVKRLSSSANTMFLQMEDSLRGGHLGVEIRSESSGNLLEAYNAHHLFVPASNAKLLTLYAALRFLGDSLVGVRYQSTQDTVYVLPSGDPTLLHNDFKQHPVYQWLSMMKKPFVFDNSHWKAEKYGNGWAWNDYQANYMPERNALPVNGNMISINCKLKAATNTSQPLAELTMGTMERPLYPESVTFQYEPNRRFSVQRAIATNGYTVKYGVIDTTIQVEMPFVTYGITTGLRILSYSPLLPADTLAVFQGKVPKALLQKSNWQVIHSQPTDSMLAIMMHRSDNFYAEQTLLMVANEVYGIMNERLVIDMLMKEDFSGMPDPLIWVDGSGLSRYNLVSPADFVWLLQKMKQLCSVKRLQQIMATANTGTLTNYYLPLQGKLFAKTGTLSGQVALSGYLTAKSGQPLVFSVIVNNHNTTATKVRRLVEKYLMQVWEKY